MPTAIAQRSRMYLAGRSSAVRGSVAPQCLHLAGLGDPTPEHRRTVMKVQDFLSDREVEFDTLPHEETFDSQHLAQALHVSGREVAKTVLLRLDHGFRYAVALVPAMHRVDLEAASHVLGGAHTELATEMEMAQCL